MTDADLTALWSAWLRDRAQIHKMINLTSAMFRAHAEAVAAADRRSPPGRVEALEDSRGRGSFAGLVRAPDGTLEPCDPGVPHQWHDTKDGQMCAACCIERPYPPQIAPPATGGVTVATVPANKALRKACNPEGSW
jgi:hypothetical protein